MRQELAAAKARIAELERAEIARLTTRPVPEHKPAQPKAEKPARNLTTELQQERLWAAMRQGIMSRETRIAIDKVLHPDGTPTDADKDRAVKGWNLWKNDSDKVRRRAR